MHYCFLLSKQVHSSEARPFINSPIPKICICCIAYSGIYEFRTERFLLMNFLGSTAIHNAFSFDASMLNVSILIVRWNDEDGHFLLVIWLYASYKGHV